MELLHHQRPENSSAPPIRMESRIFIFRTSIREEIIRCVLIEVCTIHFGWDGMDGYYESLSLYSEIN